MLTDVQIRKAKAADKPYKLTDGGGLNVYVTSAAGLDLNAVDAVHRVASFAEELMTNVGAADLTNRTGIITRGTARR